MDRRQFLGRAGLVAAGTAVAAVIPAGKAVAAPQRQRDRKYGPQRCGCPHHYKMTK